MRTGAKLKDRIIHRETEADEIERMEFFKKDQRKCSIAAGVGPLKLTPGEKRAKVTWNQIMEERRQKLPPSTPEGQRGRTKLNCRAFQGEKTGVGNFSKSLGGSRYPEYMKDADERRLKDEEL